MTPEQIKTAVQPTADRFMQALKLTESDRALLVAALALTYADGMIAQAKSMLEPKP